MKTEPVRIQERDKLILKYIYKFQCLQISQVAKLADIRCIKICQRRIRKLIKSNYLAKIDIPTTLGKSPYLLYLTERTGALFNVEVSKPRLTLTLSHQNKNSDLLIQIILSFRNSGIECEVLPEHLIRQAENEIFPDGAFMLRKNNKSALFLMENCTGTMPLRSKNFYEDIELKIARYSEELFKPNAIGFYEDYFQSTFNRFRLVYIVNSNQRLAAISKIVKQYDEHGFVWLTVMKDSR
ncbi:MAG: hypothetical protein AB1611_12860 [bacterium]